LLRPDGQVSPGRVRQQGRNAALFAPEKIAADAAARARRSEDIADYPNPDLAIEIDLSRSEIDRPAIYAALRVPDVWRFDGEQVVIDQLQPDGCYTPVAASQFLPVNVAEIQRWLVHEDYTDELEFERRLTDWARGLSR
jgi:Uma2 family endonuclease